MQLALLAVAAAIPYPRLDHVALYLLLDDCQRLMPFPHNVVLTLRLATRLDTAACIGTNEVRRVHVACI